MSGSRRRAAARLAGLAALAVAAVDRAPAQETGGLTATLDVTETLRVDDNRDFVTDPDGTSAVARTDLGFTLASETRAERIALSLDATVDAGWFGEEDSTDIELEEIGGQFVYARESRDALIGFDLTHTTSDVTAGESTSDLDVLDAISDEGERDATDLVASIEVGRTAGIGAAFGADYRRRNFRDITDPDLFDTEEAGVAATIFFRPSRTLTFRLEGDGRRYDAENTEETFRESFNLGGGVDYALTPRLDLSVDLAFTRIETTETEDDVRDTETDEGLSGRFALTRAHPTGETRFVAETTTETTGNRTSLSLGRLFEFELATLDLTAGVTTSDESDVRPFAGVTFRRETRDMAIALDLSQTATTTAEGDEVLLTTAGLEYDWALTEVSALGLDVGVSDVTLLAGDDTEERIDLRLSATYTRQLTRDWSGVVGYEFRFEDPEDSGDRRSNAVFLGLSRSFSFRP